MGNVSIGRSPITPNANSKTNQSAEIARQGRVDNRRVSIGSGTLSPIRGHVDNAIATTPTGDRTVSLVLDDPTLVPISWFTDRLPSGAGLDRESLAGDMKAMVNFAQEIDQDMLRASELLEKSEHKPLNEKEQREVNTLLGAGKYNLAQAQRWTAVTMNELDGSPTAQEFVTNLQERLANRHMDLADLMCLYDLDQTPPEQAVSRADRIDHNLVAADAALKVVGGLNLIDLSGDAKQQMIEVLENHHVELVKAKDITIGSDSAKTLAWATSFSLTKGKKADDSIASLRERWDAKVAGATGSWLPLAHPKLTQEQMLKEFVSYRLKQAGVAKENIPDLKSQFKEATIRAMNERPWEPIEKELHYSVDGESRTVHSKITPAKAMASHFAKGMSTNGIACSDRMQYTHVPNLARTELTDESGKTLFSALRHGVLDAYDISASTLRKLPDQELRTMVKDLLVRSAATADATQSEPVYVTVQRARPLNPPPAYSEEAWVSTLHFSEREFETPYWKSTPQLDTDDVEDVATIDLEPAQVDVSDESRIESESPYAEMSLDGEVSQAAASVANPTVVPTGDIEREQRVSQIVDEIRTNPSVAKKIANTMRTVASENMAKELAVAALVSDPDKLQAALDGEIVDLNLSSISLLTPDLLRRVLKPHSDERSMLQNQTTALKDLDSRKTPTLLSPAVPLNLQVRDGSGELRTVAAYCKVRAFNFGVNAGAVGKSIGIIPSQTRGWTKLMGWGYSMGHNNPELQTLLGDRKSTGLGGDVQEKLTELENTASYRRGNPTREEATATAKRITTLREAAESAKQIWREGSYNKGGQDPYKMVSRLGIVLDEMGETLAFNCKSGKDRTGQLDAELKYLTAQGAGNRGHLPDLGAPVTSELRQMRSDFTLNSGNLEMQRMNTGLPGFKLDIKQVPGLANFIAGPEMESMYRGGSGYIKS